MSKLPEDLDQLLELAENLTFDDYWGGRVDVRQLCARLALEVRLARCGNDYDAQWAIFDKKTSRR